MLASVGAILGGQAAIRGTFQQIGIGATVTGGAAFLLIVMGCVYWATRSACEVKANIKLSEIPRHYLIAGSDPAKQDFHLRVRFGNALKLAQLLDENVGYDLFVNDRPEKVVIHIDMIKDNQSVEVCRIVVTHKTASQSRCIAGIGGRHSADA